MAPNATVTGNAARSADGGGRAPVELADGSRLVPGGSARPARLDGDRDHVFTLADVQRKGAEPFAGYVRLV